MGKFTYTGFEDVEGALTAVISAQKAGSTVNYRFTISVNGVAPVFASAVYTPMEVKAAKVSQTLVSPVSLVRGDTVQLMVAGDGTGDDLTITDLVMNIVD